MYSNQHIKVMITQCTAFRKLTAVQYYLIEDKTQ